MWQRNLSLPWEISFRSCAIKTSDPSWGCKDPDFKCLEHCPQTKEFLDFLHDTKFDIVLRNKTRLTCVSLFRSRNLCVHTTPLTKFSHTIVLTLIIQCFTLFMIVDLVLVYYSLLRITPTWIASSRKLDPMPWSVVKIWI